MKKPWGSVGVLAAGLFVLSACGGPVEPELATAPPSAWEEPERSGGVEALTGRGHGCPRQHRECRDYCQGKGHTSGSCSGYGGGTCECRNTEPAPRK